MHSNGCPPHESSRRTECTSALKVSPSWRAMSDSCASNPRVKQPQRLGKIVPQLFNTMCCQRQGPFPEASGREEQKKKKATMADGADRPAPVNPEADCLGNASRNICQTKEKKPSEKHSFCCPDDVEEMARYLSTSAAPCDDFYAYVCSNTMDSRHSGTEAGPDSRIKSVALTGTLPNNAKTFAAGRFLNSFFKTCLDSITQSESFARSLANAMLHEAGNLLKNVDSRNAMAFNTEASLVYSLHSAIRVSYRVNRVVTLQINAICDPDAADLDDLNSTVDVLKRVTNSTTTMEDTVELAGQLCEQFQGEQRLAIVYHLSLDATEFTQEVWNLDEVVGSINVLGFALEDSTLLNVQGVGEIRLLYDIFLNDTREDVKAAYLLWHLVVSGVQEFSVMEGQFSPQAFETCSESTFRLGELWELFKAEIFTTPDKDAVAKNIFTLITDTYRDLIILGDRYILLSPSVYDFIRAASPNSLLPNMAIVGQLLAETLWSMALFYANWKPKTKANILNFGTCFIDTYLDNADISHKYHVLYTSLGMSTVVSALNRSDWHVMHNAWSLWRFSHAQFFYIFNSHYRCPNNPSVHANLEIEVPLMYVQDFARAFSCPTNTSMEPRGCLDPVQNSK
ncbi:hypothetical protein HPB52_018231 [Rhipicephalus sanguineus]|uniref:Uncharacterized protein n=1 Tax=Rhipicephalus sanguineus TaxID=34632 RepID=A0A9D4PSA3_RHISA|nr:hypothetical protein HPB52_018231 [Rhipicephalus sanguineus]